MPEEREALVRQSLGPWINFRRSVTSVGTTFNGPLDVMLRPLGPARLFLCTLKMRPATAQTARACHHVIFIVIPPAGPPADSLIPQKKLCSRRSHSFQRSLDSPR